MTCTWPVWQSRSGRPSCFSVWYQTTDTLPASPAAIHGQKTRVPGCAIVTGADHVAPRSVVETSMIEFACVRKSSLRLGANPLSRQRRVHSLGKRAGDAFRGLALLRQDPLAHPGRRLVAGAAGHPRELLVAPDLEVLEGAHEGRQLAGGVGMAAEERAPVERPEPQGRVLQGRRAGAERAQAFLDELRVIARLGEMVLVEVGERVAARELRPALEQRNRLLLDRVRVPQVLAQLLGPIVAPDGVQRRVDRDVERVLEPR